MVSENRPEKALTDSDKKKFRSLLLAKRSEILGDVDHMQTSALDKSGDYVSHSPSHMADVGSDNYETENILGLMESERELLFEIEEAIKRLDNDTYGICQGNGESISRPRLKAIPWARYCVQCASQMERFNPAGNGNRRKYFFAPGQDDMDDDDSSFRDMMEYGKD